MKRELTYKESQLPFRIPAHFFQLTFLFIGPPNSKYDHLRDGLFTYTT